MSPKPILIPKIVVFLTAVMAILIGLEHLRVHFAQLVSPELASRLGFDLEVLGHPMDVYGAWQGFSFMMGVSFVTIGLLLLVAYLRRGEAPGVMVFAVLIMFLSAVVYSGVHYFGPKQIYGGLFGVVLNLTGLIFALRGRRAATRTGF